jgi:SRSO17 transposase
MRCSDLGSTLLHWRLFIPQTWADDPERRAKAGIPAALVHRTKQQIALELLDEAAEWGLKPPVVIADSDYGTDVAFRNSLTQREIPWLVAVNGDTTVLPVTGTPVKAWAKRRPAIGVSQLARSNQHRARQFIYRPETVDHRARSGWFVAIPVHIAGIIERGHIARTEHRLLPERLLLIQWRDQDDAEEFRAWITDLPADTPLATLVKHATSRSSIETDYREMEQALGLGDYEGRGYARFHHHVTLVSAAHPLPVLPGTASQPKAADTD